MSLQLTAAYNNCVVIIAVRVLIGPAKDVNRQNEMDRGVYQSLTMMDRFFVEGFPISARHFICDRQKLMMAICIFTLNAPHLRCVMMTGFCVCVWIRWHCFFLNHPCEYKSGNLTKIWCRSTTLSRERLNNCNGAKPKNSRIHLGDHQWQILQVRRRYCAIGEKERSHTHRSSDPLTSNNCPLRIHNTRQLMKNCSNSQMK